MTAAIPYHGQIAAEGTPLKLKDTYTKDYVTLYAVDENAVRALNRPYTPVRDGFRVSVAPDTASATKLIVQNPDLFQDYEITKGKMDDIFLAVTGRKLGEEQ